MGWPARWTFADNGAVWSDAKAAAAQRELLALDAAGLGVADLHAGAIEVISKQVPYDATCWATVDPRAGVVTGQLTVDFTPSTQQEALFAQLESTGERNTFVELITRGVAAARLSDLPHREVVRSRRINELYRPMGFAHEVRLIMSASGLPWGVAGLLRSAGSDFTDEETAFLRRVSGPLGEATRRATLRSVASDEDVPRGAIVILVDAGGQFRSATAAALPWLEGPDAARFTIALRTVSAAVSANPSGSARLRLRDRTGSWVTLTASPLLGSGADLATAVSIEPASGRDLADVLLAGHGLTEREREVCALVVAGRSTHDIAATLFLSAHTVQDHLKSIFAKVGVRSRRELVALLNPR